MASVLGCKGADQSRDFKSSILPPSLLAGRSEGELLFLLASAFIAGLARGFSGFGAALIFMPLASAVIGPQSAAPLLLIIDAVTAIGLIPDAWRRSDRKGVGIVAIGALIGIPLGTLVLTLVDPLVVRWIIVLVVMALLTLLVSGWRYHGRPAVPVTIRDRCDLRPVHGSRANWRAARRGLLARRLDRERDCASQYRPVFRDLNRAHSGELSRGWLDHTSGHGSLADDRATVRFPELCPRNTSVRAGERKPPSAAFAMASSQALRCSVCQASTKSCADGSRKLIKPRQMLGPDLDRQHADLGTVGCRRIFEERRVTRSAPALVGICIPVLNARK